MKTGFLMFGLVFLFVAIGGILGNQQGALIGLLIAGGMSFYSYWFSDKMVIRAYNGQEVTPENNPRLYQLIQRLAKNANLPMPKIYIIPERQPNAFATGRNPQNAAYLSVKEPENIETILKNFSLLSLFVIETKK